MSWCPPWKTWKKVYKFDPREANIGSNRTLGAEVTLWSELISEDNFDYIAWPRCTAFSRKMWIVDENVRNIGDN